MSSEPRLPSPGQPAPGGVVLGVGTDLVHVPGLAYQLTIPGTVFAERAFTARELRDAMRLADAGGSLQAEHLAARWAAKEAFVKAWSQTLAGLRGPAEPAQIPPESLDWREIEIIRDSQGRPSVSLAGKVRDAVGNLLGSGGAAPATWPLSLTHDADWAAATVLCAPSAPCGSTHECLPL